MYISKILVVAKYLLMALIGSSFDVFGFFGMAQPIFWQWATENKMFAIMMTFFFSNMLEAQLVSSGAFEITLNDMPIWSKIATGRIPAPQELFQIIESHLQFTDNLLEKNPDFVK
jgi:thioredoxin reductase-like selenoprotein T